MTGKIGHILKDSYLRRMYIILFAFWTAAILVLTYFIYDLKQREIWQLAVKECQTNFDKDVMYRLWASGHGGVYVPVNEKTLPNPYLAHIPERDITTPSGKKLTLVNPAYMTRQVYELGAERFQYKGHITSLNPIRKENLPDEWEAEVLKSFEKGVKKRIELANLNNETHIRFMLPFVTEKSCLKCHGQQGYKVGDVRGGISVSLPWNNYKALLWNEMQYQFIGHFILWLLGFAGLYISYSKMKKNYAEKDLLLADLKNNDNILNTLLNGIHESALLIDCNGIILAANNIVDNRINNGKRDLLGKNVFDYLEKEVADRRKEYISEVIKTKDQLDFVDIRKGRYIHNFLTPILNENGVVTKIAAIGIDITVQKEIEKSLSESEEKFRLMFENAASGMVLVTPKFLFVKANTAFCNMVGYNENELLGKSFQDITFEEDKKVGQELITSLLKGDIEKVQFEKRYNHKNGNIVWGIVSAAVLRDKNNNPVNLITQIVDITNQKKALEALKESEEKFQKAFQNAPILISITELESGVYLDVNEEALIVSGFTRDEVIGHTAAELGWITQESRKMLVEEVSSKGRIAGLEMTFVAKDGHLITGYVKGETVNIFGKECLLTATLDITERKKTEYALKESEEKFRMMFQNAASGMVLATPQFHFVKVNTAFCNMVGYSEEELLGKSFQDITFEEDRKIGYELTVALLKGEIEKVQFEKRYNHKNGNIVWGIVSAAALRDKYNQTINFVTQIVDITKQKKALEDLKESEEKFRQITASISDISYSCVEDNAGNSSISWIYGAIEQITGYSEDELMKMKCWGKIVLDEDFAIFKKSILDLPIGETSNCQLRIRKKDNSVIWVFASAKSVQAVESQNKKTIYGALLNITEQKTVETELEQYRHHLEELVEERTEEIDAINKQLHEALAAEKELSSLKSRFISTASHEFRTPLTSVLTSAELIQKYKDKWSQEKVNEHLERIKSSVGYLTKLMTEVLEVNKGEARKLDYIPSEFDLFELCSKVIHDLNIYYEEKIKFTFNFLAERKVFTLDRKQTELMVSNLLTNAVKYSPKGGKVELVVNNSLEFITIKVCDEGIGIPNDELPRLFEPFHRAKNTTDIQGTGLGLSIVKNAVELHKGKIEVESKEGIGSTFIIELPILS